MDIIEALKLALDDWPFVTLVAIVLAFILGRNIIQKKVNPQPLPYWFILLLVVAILLFVGSWIAFKWNSSWIGEEGIQMIGIILQVFVTGALCYVTYLLYKATKSLAETSAAQAKTATSQTFSSLTTAWQNEWHDKEDIKIRKYIMSDRFEKDLEKVITAIYKKEISCTNIEALLSPPKEITENLPETQKLFKTKLEGITVEHSQYSAYDAAERVLLSFDRLAVLRDVPEAENLIMRYRPVFRYLKDSLQAFIAIAYIALEKEKKFKNYKKDFIFLLYKLGLHNPDLLQKCVKELIGLKELTPSEFEKETKERLYDEDGKLFKVNLLD
jgi:hypothetical protein